MYRRSIITGAALGVLAQLAGCGDGGSDDAASLEPVVEPGGHEHIDGLASLPSAPPPDLALLAQVTPGEQFAVRVRLGAQVCAGASVQVFDVHGVLIDTGTANADGVYRSAQLGRKFMAARADVAGLGTLWGFEFNTVGKPEPTIDVNLLATLAHRLDERHALGAHGADFLLKSFLDIRSDALVSDEEGLAGEFDQERMRLHLQRSGLSLAAYVDTVVDAMLAALERGLAAPQSTEYRRLLDSAAVPEECKLLPIYDESWSDDWDHPYWARVRPLIEANWPAAVKAIVAFALKMVAKASGYAFIAPVGELILNKLLPAQRNPQMEALQEIQNQLRVLQTSMQAMEQRFKEAEFTRLYDEVRNTFNRFDAVTRDLAETQAYYTRNGLPTDQNFNDLVVARCRLLFSMEIDLLEAENKFLGLGAFAGTGLLNRWHEIHRQRPFYTAIVQKQYMDLLDYYVNWMNRIYAYVINAYTAYAETTGTAVNVHRVNQLGERVVKLVELLEAMRPRYLPSEKMVVDLHHGLAWVGRGNVATDFHTFIPADFADGTYKRRDISNFLQIGYEEDNPCRERMMGSPVRDASIREDVATEFSWRLPTRNDLERSFKARISARYGKKFNLLTFLADFDIPACFTLFSEEGRPLQVVMRDGMTVKRTRVARGVYRRYLWISVFHLSDLGTGSFPNHSSYAPIHMYYFPVATLTAEQLTAFVPWQAYDAAIARHAATV